MNHSSVRLVIKGDLKVELREVGIIKGLSLERTNEHFGDFLHDVVPLLLSSTTESKPSSETKHT
jgi:hypothetical protein